MSIQFLNRYCRLSLIFVFILGMVACGGGGGGSSSPSNINTAPVASDVSISLLPGATITGILKASDADGDAVTYSIITQPSDGTLSLDDPATGAYVYINNGIKSSDSFTFKVNDGKLDSNIATVRITTIVADAPASGLIAMAGDESNKLNWDAVTGADSYNVYRSDTPGTGTGGTEIASGIKPPFYDNGLSNGSTYYYVVTSVNVVGESAASTEINATPADILISSLSFTDGNLQTCVNAAGGTYVHDLVTLDCSGRNIISLSGMEALTSLTTLSLYNNSISDVSPLAGLTNLIALTLSNNIITDVSPLAGLTGLNQLYLENDSIGDVSPLADLVNLYILYLDGNNISKVGPLAGLSSLLKLWLFDNNITDVGPLAGLGDLIDLRLNNNNITDVGPLASLTNLTNLWLSNNSIVDVSPLSYLTSLTTLDLASNNIGGEGVGHVDTLVSLTATTQGLNGVIELHGNLGMSCNELSLLIGGPSGLGSPPVDTDMYLPSYDVATPFGYEQNCTMP